MYCNFNFKIYLTLQLALNIFLLTKNTGGIEFDMKLYIGINTLTFVLHEKDRSVLKSYD